MANQQNENVFSSILEGVDKVLSTKTVVGEPTKIDDTIILPLVDVLFGCGTGSGTKEKSANSCGGFGGKMSPSAVLIIKDGHARLVNIKNQDAVTKLLDLVPEVLERVTSKKSNISDSVAKDVAFPEDK